MGGERSDEVPEVLVDCHRRMRQVVTLAADLAARADAPPDEVREVVKRVHRYFTVALRMHEEDEERSLFPRLVARSPALGPTVERLRADHQAQQARVGEVLATCEELLASPERFAARRGALGAAAWALLDSWEVHLALEEAELFPAVRTALTSAERAAIEDEMRARRADLPPR
jgi:hemerythrin-like domain-containing protein